MNNQEKTAAEQLLTKLQNAAPNDAVQIATAYQALMQGVLSRFHAENPRP
jgi:hypothetical protein